MLQIHLVGESDYMHHDDDYDSSDFISMESTFLDIMRETASEMQDDLLDDLDPYVDGCYGCLNLPLHLRRRIFCKSHCILP